MEQRTEYVVKGKTDEDCRRVADQIARAVSEYAYGSLLSGRKFSCEIHSDGNKTATLKLAQYIAIR